MQLFTTFKLLQPTRQLTTVVFKPAAVRVMSSGSVPADADIKAAREGEPQFHGSGAPLNPEDTGSAAGRASEGGAAVQDKDATQPTAADEEFAMNEPKGTAEASSGSAVNPPGFDSSAATDPEGGAFSGGGVGASPGLPSTGAPVKGFSQD